MMRVEQDQLHRSRLHDACVHADMQQLRTSLEAGANPNATDANGWTPLHFAAQANWPEGAMALIEAGAAIDPEDGHGNTPLFRAVFNSRGHGAVIKVLLEAGADASHKNRYGVSPRSLAQTIANYDVAQYFE
jgi:ankyrin repeat protein